MDESRFVEVYRARNSPQALVMKEALEAEGIPVMLENELLQGAVGELPIGWATAPRIMVATEDAQRAREFLLEWERKHQPAEGQDDLDDDEEDAEIEAAEEEPVCLACGARMTAEESTCKACGWTYEVDDSAKSN